MADPTEEARELVKELQETAAFYEKGRPTAAKPDGAVSMTEMYAGEANGIAHLFHRAASFISRTAQPQEVTTDQVIQAARGMPAHVPERGYARERAIGYNNGRAAAVSDLELLFERAALSQDRS